MQKNKNLANYFEENLSKDKFVYEIDTKTKKFYVDILEDAKKLSLLKIINKREKILVILPNSINYIEIFLASLFGGWIFSPIPYFIQTQELLNKYNSKTL